MEDISKPLLLLSFFGCYYFPQIKRSFYQRYTLSIWYFFFGIMVGAYFFDPQEGLEKRWCWTDDSRNSEQWYDAAFISYALVWDNTFFSKMENYCVLGSVCKKWRWSKIPVAIAHRWSCDTSGFSFNYYLPQKFSLICLQRQIKDGAAKLFRNAARAIFVCQVICLAGRCCRWIFLSAKL